MEHKCTVIQRECKEREDMKNSKQKEPECEYKCCDGELCNTDPCSVGVFVYYWEALWDSQPSISFL